MENKNTAPAVGLDAKAHAVITLDKPCNNYGKSRWGRYNLLAFLGFATGSATALTGLVLSVVAWFSTTNTQRSLSFWGTLLVAITIPFLGLGAHALDKIDTKRVSKSFQA